MFSRLLLTRTCFGDPDVQLGVCFFRCSGFVRDARELERYSMQELRSVRLKVDSLLSCCF